MGQAYLARASAGRQRPVAAVIIQCRGVGCLNLVEDSGIFYPYCSTNCEQLSEFLLVPSHTVAVQPRPPAVVVKQTTLPEGEDWEPQQPDRDSLDWRVITILRDHPGRRWTKSSLVGSCSSLKELVNERKVSEAVERLRRLGWPVISDSQEPGYWLSWDREEVKKLLNNLRRRSFTMLKTALLVERAAARQVTVPFDSVLNLWQEIEPETSSDEDQQ